MRNDDEKKLRAMIEAWNAALVRRDVDAMMADYAPEAHLFDCKPPYTTDGRDAIRALWEACLPFFPKRFETERHDEHLVVGEDMAVFRALHRFKTPDDPGHPAGRMWLRVSVCYRKTAQGWKVFHEHVSTPFNPMTGQIAPIVDAADLSCGVDYSGCKPQGD